MENASPSTAASLTSHTTEILTTTDPCAEQIPSYWGYISALIAVLFFGSNFAPVKKFESGDGMFFQWVMCLAIWITGVIVFVVRDCPKFYPIVMLGGVIFVTGNMCVVPIIKTIGMGVGLSSWGMVSLVSGWATGRFGLFGVHQEIPDNVYLNYAGVGLSILSALIFAMVKADVGDTAIDGTYTEQVDEYRPLLAPADSLSINSIEAIIATGAPERPVLVFERLSPSSKKAMGFTLCLFSGLLYGQVFTPAIYVQDRYSGSSQEALDYVFPYSCGIFTVSTIYFLLYCAMMKNNPRVYPRVILPGFVSGLMFGFAVAAWFVANKTLSEPVAYPMIPTGQAVVASLLAVFVFKEIRGRRNMVILCLAFVVTLTGVALTAASKKPPKETC